MIEIGVDCRSNEVKANSIGFTPPPAMSWRPNRYRFMAGWTTAQDLATAAAFVLLRYFVLGANGPLTSHYGRNRVRAKVTSFNIVIAGVFR